MSPQIAASALIDEIHKAVYGTELDRAADIGQNPLFQELSSKAKALIEYYAKHPVPMVERKPYVSVPGIRNWFRPVGSASEPKKRGKQFLRDYLHDVLQDAKRQLELHNRDRLSEIWASLSTFAQPHIEPSATGALDPVVVNRLTILLGISHKNPRSIADDLFRDGDPNDPNDFSYFLCYRHSTNRGAILKSFFVLQKPNPKLFNDYGFNHFVWGGKSFNDHIFRECEGLILKMDVAYYLLGYNFIVPVDKRRHSERYEAHRAESRGKANGMGLTAMEYRDIDASPGFFGGMTMTLAAAHQPIAARVAFIHIGTKSALGREIRDNHLEPTEIYSRELATDLRNTVRKLKALKCDKFGMYLQRCVDAPAWETKGAAKLAHDIRQMIDNLPAWERVGAKGASRLRARGAIETFGEKRPRD